MKSSEIKEFGLVIIESLSKQDKKTGKLLFDNIIKYKKFQEENLSALLYQVQTKKEFIDTLDLIISKTKDDKFFPILHLEAHGSDKGIHLASNERLTWDELFAKTREINVLLKNALVLNLSMCKGLSIISKLEPSKRAPFKAVIGTTKIIGETNLVNAYEAFYDHYFFTFLPQESVQKMNEVLENTSAKFNVLVSDRLFDEILDPERDPENLQFIINEIVMDEKANNPIYTNTSIDEIKKDIELSVRTILEEEKKNKDFFTMKDLKQKAETSQAPS